MKERYKQVLAERRAGLMFKEIGKKHGVSTERARQIYLKATRLEKYEAFKKRRFTLNLVERLEGERLRINAIRKFNEDDLTEADKDLLQKIDNLIEVFSE